MVTAVWTDSHCHLQDQYLEEGSDEVLGAVLRRSYEAGVHRLVCIGTDAVSSAAAIDVARRAESGALGTGLPEVWCSAGLHPHDAVEGTGDLESLLQREHPQANLVAVGECGLDYYYEHSPRPVQREVLARQIQLACELDLALVIHARDAFDDLFAIFDSEGVAPRTVIHCFTGSPADAEGCLERGAFISISGVVTFKNADDVRAAVAIVPLDHLMVETDSPFLAPVPHRGARNEPSLVPVVGAAVAAIRGMTPAELAQSTWQAAEALFRPL